MKLILIDEIPENPLRKYSPNNYDLLPTVTKIDMCKFGMEKFNAGQQSILSKAIPIEKLDEIFTKYGTYCILTPMSQWMNFSKFFSEQLGVK